MTDSQIRITYSQYGEVIDDIEMLLLPKAKLILSLNEDNTVQFTVKDTDFDNQNLTGSLSYETLDAMIKQLIKMRNQTKIK